MAVVQLLYWFILLWHGSFGEIHGNPPKDPTWGHRLCIVLWSCWEMHRFGVLRVGPFGLEGWPDAVEAPRVGPLTRAWLASYVLISVWDQDHMLQTIRFIRLQWRICFLPLVVRCPSMASCPRNLNLRVGFATLNGRRAPHQWGLLKSDVSKGSAQVNYRKARSSLQKGPMNFGR